MASVMFREQCLRCDANPFDSSDTRRSNSVDSAWRCHALRETAALPVRAAWWLYQAGHGSPCRGAATDRLRYSYPVACSRAAALPPDRKLASAICAPSAALRTPRQNNNGPGLLKVVPAAVRIGDTAHACTSHQRAFDGAGSDLCWRSACSRSDSSTCWDQAGQHVGQRRAHPRHHTGVKKHSRSAKVSAWHAWRAANPGQMPAQQLHSWQHPRWQEGERIV